MAVSARQFRGVNNPEVIVRTSDKPSEAINRIRLCLTELYGGTRFLTDVLDGTVSGVFDHGLLTGLGDDDHTQYLLLAGRSGGQTAIGGTGSDTFELRSNSLNNATTARFRITSTPGFQWDIASGSVVPLTFSPGPVSGMLTGLSLSQVMNATGGNSSTIRINNTSGSTSANLLTVDKIASQTGRMARFRGASPTFTELTYVGGNGEVSIAPDADATALTITANAASVSPLISGTDSLGSPVFRVTDSSSEVTSNSFVDLMRMRFNPNGFGVSPALSIDASAITANRSWSFPDSAGIFIGRVGTLVNTTGRTTSVATTNLVTSPTTQMYQVNAYMHCSTAGDAGDNVQLNLLYDDGSGVRTLPLFTLNLAAAGNFGTYTICVYHTAGTNLRYNTILTSPGAGTPAHTIRLRATALG